MYHYRCGRCGEKVEKSALICPGCGAKLGSIRCSQCDYTGVPSEFINDRCPRCRAVLRTTPVRGERCRECGRPMEPWRLSCAHCGHTEWGNILLVAGLAIASIVGALVFLPMPTVWTVLVGGVGVALFFTAMFAVGTVMRWRVLVTLLTTALLLSGLTLSSLAARYRYSEDPVIQAPQTVAEAAALTETPTPTATLFPTMTPEPSPTPSLTGSILVELGNIRQEPDMESAIVGQVAKDEMIVLLGRSADGAWARMITTAGTEGWVWAPLVQSTPAVKDLPEYKPQQ